MAIVGWMVENVLSRAKLLLSLLLAANSGGNNPMSTMNPLISFGKAH